MSHRVAFDLELCRPGCAIIQAAMGGSDGIANVFPSETWLRRGCAPEPE